MVGNAKKLAPSAKKVALGGFLSSRLRRPEAGVVAHLSSLPEMAAVV